MSGKHCPIRPGIVDEQSTLFKTEFGSLLGEIDQAAREDLPNLFTDFAHLALRLWKIQTSISIVGMPELAHLEFQPGSAELQGEPAVVSALGQELNGRPIGVVIRPLIISEPVVPEGKPQQQVVWSKALVSVSAQR